MQDGQWRTRAVAAETACAAGIETFTKLLDMIESGPECTDLTPLVDDASKALAAMREAAAAKGDARAKDSRRMRRSDALVLAQLAAALLTAGHRGSASAVARIAHRMAKLTGAASALAIADGVPTSDEERTLPASNDREQIAIYFEHLARGPIGSIDLQGEPMSFIWGCAASWIRNCLDVKWGEEMRASGALSPMAPAPVDG